MSEPRQVQRMGNLSSDFWQRQGDIGMLQYKDVYPDDEAMVHPTIAARLARGLWGRLVNRHFSKIYDDHFRSGVMPAGYAWITDATFTGTPPNGSVVQMPSYWGFESTAGGGGVPPYFMARVPNFASLWWASFHARVQTPRVTEVGVRMDDGSDNNYGMIILDPDDVGGYNVDFRYRIGGGAVTDVPGPYRIATEFTVAELYWNIGAGNQIFGRLKSESGGTVFMNGFSVNAIGWTPTRAGLVLYGAGGANTTASCDWIHYEDVEW